MKIELEPTGERVIEDAYMHTLGAYTIYSMHAASYRFAEEICGDKKVLDLGCGSGYGAMRLSQKAAEVYGVDISGEAIAYADENYQRDNLHFQKIEPDARLPFPDSSFDVVLSFQVIEHVSDEDGYLQEARRVLAPGGTLIVITPDRRNRLFPGQKPWNRWHLREYDMDTLANLIGRHLSITKRFRMGASWKIASVEINRYRRTKWLCLPATLPFLPDSIRIAALNLAHRVLAARNRPRNASEINEFCFDERDFIIDEEAENSLNLIITAQK
ncbi:class I SAM-dependent methyltransferase [Stenotrophomonas sp. SY1]|uniref:class I SAM-dependent methyltransferase n=1 Tax=Stenotrophomonas sp. SY1 TaxID=477235 RepID=UPI001E3D0FEC|nr:class I SAM-dependent methyltransferase [Stenotrophomonas sp. SY1]MCD9086157.1 class I SAM-dependent methyltransferase [Stenotrophomonas sp. SY1]